MVPVQKTIFGSLAALVLILTTYICATSHPVETDKIEPRVELRAPKRIVVNKIAPIPLPDFSAAKPISERDETHPKLDSTVIVSSEPRQDTNPEWRPNSGEEKTSNLYPTPILNSEYASHTLDISSQDISSQDIDWQYPDHVIPRATIANFQKKMAYGKKLARVGALASAEKEAQLGLKLVAESLDFSTRLHTLYTKKIDDVFVTLDEMTDFRAENSNLVDVILSHKTPILKEEHPANLSRNLAQLAYLSYAEEQLIGIFANYKFCSDAFFTLGKIFLSSRIGNENTEVATMKAMLMFRMAVTLNPADSQSANELGAMYAGLNYLDVAKEYFLQSVRNSPTPIAWQNLARIHRMLGEHQLAIQAENEARILSQGSSQKVSWVTPDEFGRANQFRTTNGTNRSSIPPANRNSSTPALNQPNLRQSGFQRPASPQPGMIPGIQSTQPSPPQKSTGRIAGIPIPNIMNLWK